MCAQQRLCGAVALPGQAGSWVRLPPTLCCFCALDILLMEASASVGWPFGVLGRRLGAAEAGLGCREF